MRGYAEIAEIYKDMGASAPASRGFRRVWCRRAAVLTPEKDRVVRVAIPLNQLRQVKNEIMLLASIFLYLLPFLAVLILFFLARYLKRTTSVRPLK